MIKTLVPWILAFAVSAGAAMAQDAGVRCVQQQLSTAGFNPGPLDGIPGRATRQAMRNFFALHGQAVPTNLTGNNGMVLCRQIGLLDTSLQIHWPARRTPVIATASAGVDRITEGAVYGAAHKALSRISAWYGFEIPMPVQVVVADNARDLERMLLDRADGNLNDLRAQADYHCSAPGGISGLAYFDLLGICIRRGASVSGNLDVRDLNLVVAHEVTHAVQAQLVGHAPWYRDLSSHIGHRGPLWLTEGSATFISEMLNWNDVGIDEIAESLHGDLLTGDWPVLSDLALRQDTEEETRQLYHGGSFAVASMISPTEAAIPNLLGYYEDIGLGATWEEAFEARFGQSPATFYANFALLGPEDKGEAVDQK